VLGFFPDRQTAGKALEALSRDGFRRAAMVYQPLTGRTPAAALGEALGGATARTYAATVGRGIDERLLARYRRWVMPDETLVLVQSAPQRVDEALSVLQRGRDGAPDRADENNEGSENGAIGGTGDGGEIDQRGSRDQRGGGGRDGGGGDNGQMGAMDEVATFVHRPTRRLPVDARPGNARPQPERFTAERLRLRAARLAESQRITLHHTAAARRRPLWHGLTRCERVIETVTRDLGDAVRAGQGVSLAGQWLLDNVYLLRRQIADVRLSFSRRLYDALPVLEGEQHGGEPRIYELALELVAHSKAQIDIPELVNFLCTYQATRPLTIGELWAMPLTLRLALIENLAQVAVEIDRRQVEHEWADFWANRLLGAARRDPDQLLFMLAELAREYSAPPPYFSERLVSQLHGEPSALEPARGWLERKLGAQMQDVVQLEQLRQATDQLMVANSIGSLRLLGEVDWRDVFEQVSPVHDVLKQDPAGVYATMDFTTRDRYRHAVEDVALHSPVTEVEVASAAVQLAKRAQQAQEAHEASAAGSDALEQHAGYFLIGGGRLQLETLAGFRAPRTERLRRWGKQRPTTVLAGGIVLVSATLLVAALTLAWPAIMTLVWPLTLLVFVLAAFPASEVAVQLVNAIVARAMPSRVLPRLSFDGGIPDAWQTLVVVPMLLSPEDVQPEIDRLEVRFLGNRDANLHFALLADFLDAPQVEMPEDDGVLAAATAGIRRLNERYETDRFSLFYRKRVWSESEQAWMGWERKRGKLEELNRLLVSLDPDAIASPDASSALLHVGGAGLDALASVRLVITLDSDTQLPHGAARRMVETMAHPLNRPRLAPDGQTVGSGYAIVQPRVTTSLPSATATRFSRVFTDPVGTDPYTQAVSDVHQDLSGEGSYHGKGIYDLRTFHDLLDGRFPEALLLSHDLVEGAHVRVGLVSDIELFDLFPGSYQAYAARDHRWIRGDWQIADWCMPWVPRGPAGRRASGDTGVGALGESVSGGRGRNPLSPINRWKIFDNLRRSLVPPASVGLLAAGWLLLPGAAAAWLCTLLVALTLLLPPALSLLTWLIGQRATALTPWRGAEGWRVQRTGWIRAVFQASLLPHQALVSLDAIWRVAYRRAISKRSLLLWRTSSAAGASAKARERRFIWKMGTVTLFAVALGVVLTVANPGALGAALPFLVAWLAAPGAVAWLTGRTLPRARRTLPADDLLFLGRLARRTWRYFDDFVGPCTNWLPPDNYQAALRVELAERTSPTNIGLGLLATVSAHDFGYLALDQMIERGEKTFETLGRLERFQGHLLNWYHTGTLEPLPPRYVSTVDSGNLLGCLTALVQAYIQKLDQPVLGPEALSGLRDTLGVLCEPHESGTPATPGDGHGASLLAALTSLVAPTTTDGAEIIKRLRQALVPARELEELFGAVPAGYWATQARRQIEAHLEVADRYVAWIEPGVPVPSIRELTQNVDSSPSGAATDAVDQARWLAGEMLARVERLILRATLLADEMDMRFLYHAERKLFTIGYSAGDRRADASHYDLLASESRLGSLVAIARGDVPVDHWLALGRSHGIAAGRTVLLSWSGTMFEYLMPLLLTRTYENSFLEEVCRDAVAAQVAYGVARGVPWGVSEAAYSAVDAHHIYQYQAFGVPGLGLKRGLEDDLVVAPYATALALLVEPRLAVANLRRLATVGLSGDYGYFESIDYTPQRLGAGERSVIVSTYMAHHQGMTLLAAGNVLHRNAMPGRFHADPRIRAAESLLFERVPVAPPVTEGTAHDASPARVTGLVADVGSRFTGPDSPTPRIQLLANQNYAVMVTSAGGGYSRWRDLDIARWSADTTRDNSGSFIYVKDLDDGAFWSAAHHPVGRKATRYNALLSPARVEFDRRDAGIGTRTEIAVSSEDDAEVRRVTLANYSNRPRHIEITSYVELALAAHNADRAHPAFSKLFVRTEALPQTAQGRGLLAWRTPRSPHDPAIWAAHVLALPPEIEVDVQYETNRGRFIGRGRSLQHPHALDREGGELSNEAGYVLDAIFSLRCRVTLSPGQRVQLSFITAAAEDRPAILALAEKYADPRAAERAFELAWSRAQLVPRQLRVPGEDLPRFQRLASLMLYPSATLRASESQLRQNRLGQSRLWTYGISGDLPIMLVQVGDSVDVELVAEALAAHSYWRLHGLKADLVILDEEAPSYEQPLGEALKRLVQASAQVTGMDQPGGVFVRSAKQIPGEDLALLQAVARVVLVAARGSLAQQLATPPERVKLPPPLTLGAGRRVPEEPSAPLPFMELAYFNGYGGFTPDGREYAMYLGPGTHTPAPWVNVMAGPRFGALVSEAGQGFAWYGNSQSNRLLPWSNDPVSDPSGDAIYIRDEQSGIFWTPTPAPVRELDAYRARHGQGYTVFEHNSHAIEQELTITVPLDEHGGAPVRLQRLRLRNRSSRRRRLSVTSFAEWVLGTSREETQVHVVTAWDIEAGALLARNAYHADYPDRVAFASVSLPVASYTADRTEFLGRNGGSDRPAAMTAQLLSGHVGAGLDPCAALQVLVDLAPGEETEVTFALGQTDTVAQARALIRAFRDPEAVERALGTTRAWWERLLETVQVETPDLAVNFLLNRWLPYQTLSCRVWGRSAFYQSGGAFGFRDQLQDSMALVYANPALVRALLLTVAAHQFPEGDVQHWWHPPSGAGIRTRFSDDLLWLPYVTAHYVRVTGDTGVLNELVSFVEGRVLEPGEHEAYFVPTTSLETASLLEHCRRAIKQGLTAGPNGLPLMGTGDWNDGMNLVGAGGRGESVWLGWFLIDVLDGFADVLERHVGLAEHANALNVPVTTPIGDQAADYRSAARRIAAAIEAAAWDGEWYRRATFDDGTPLGSAQSQEARIDSLPQSWAVLSGAGDPARAKQAMASANEHLVREEDAMVLLFTPPFTNPSHDPGYIKGYPPGVRENGGQYTHGAIWQAMAMARMGDGDGAVRLLRMLNPVEHARTPEAAEQYRVEPYVVAADVYSLDGHVGRGGWTWYTGSSGWMYRVWLEEVFGFHVNGSQLELRPVLPRTWGRSVLRYLHRGTHHETLYVITIENLTAAAAGPSSLNARDRATHLTLDGVQLSGHVIGLQDDGIEHQVIVRIG